MIRYVVTNHFNKYRMNDLKQLDLEYIQEEEKKNEFNIYIYMYMIL